MQWDENKRMGRVPGKGTRPTLLTRNSHEHVEKTV